MQPKCQYILSLFIQVPFVNDAKEKSPTFLRKNRSDFTLILAKLCLVKRENEKSELRIYLNTASQVRLILNSCGCGCQCLSSQFETHGYNNQIILHGPLLCIIPLFIQLLIISSPPTSISLSLSYKWCGYSRTHI